MADIKYFEDIVEELSEELDIDEKQLTEILKLNIDYIHKLTKDPNVISIRLPKLGVLHFNSKRAQSTYTNSGAYKNYIETVDSQLDIVDDVYSENKNLVHKRTSFLSLFKAVFFKDRRKRRTVSKKKVFEKLEIKQNKINK
jgi:hypothetical protein